MYIYIETEPDSVSTLVYYGMFKVQGPPRTANQVNRSCKWLLRFLLWDNPIQCCPTSVQSFDWLLPPWVSARKMWLQLRLSCINRLTWWCCMASQILVDIGSCNGLLSHGTKPLRKWDSVALKKLLREISHKISQLHNLNHWVLQLHNSNYCVLQLHNSNYCVTTA